MKSKLNFRIKKKKKKLLKNFIIIIYKKCVVQESFIDLEVKKNYYKH
jgi:hypothetical protein